MKPRWFREGNRVYQMNSVCFLVYDAESGMLKNMYSLQQARGLFPDIVAYLSTPSTPETHALEIALASKLNIGSQ